MKYIRTEPDKKIRIFHTDIANSLMKNEISLIEAVTVLEACKHTILMEIMNRNLKSETGQKVEDNKNGE